MRRILFTIAAAVSLVLCLAFGVLWERSYTVCDYLCYSLTDRNAPMRAPPSILSSRSLPADRPWYMFRELDIESANGSVCVGDIYWLSQAPSDFASGLSWQRHHRSQLAISCTKRFGFGWGPRGATLSKAVIVPHWMLMLGTAALPVMWLRRRIREGRRLGKGYCQVCGYDLRATPDRCPECGTISTPAAVKT